MDSGAFQDIGDKLTKALISGDFATYRSLILLPLRVSPRSGTPYVLTDENALREDFDLYHQIISLNAVTDIFRDVKEVIPKGPNETEVHFMTHIMQRANRIVDPFLQQFHLRCRDGTWLIAEIESTEGHINWTLGRTELPGLGRLEQEGNDDA